MSKLFGKIAGFFSRRDMVGVDKAGNRYFARNEVLDGVTKEKRWVIFKGEHDPTSIPVEWICWLNGQRKKAPTYEEMLEMEARRELVRQNVERLKKEEEERMTRQGIGLKRPAAGKSGGPDLQSFLQQLRSSGAEQGEASETSAPENTRASEERENVDETITPEEETEARTTEPTGSGASFKPGTWQPPT